jgi:hypothetical protein
MADLPAGLRLWHGGIPGLRPGDTIRPGHDRKTHPGCPYCADRDAQQAGGTAPAIDPLAARQDVIYLTPVRDYARHYASLWGRGDLYRVEPIGGIERSTEDTIETWMASAAVVVSVPERAVLLTMSQRRRLDRMWAAADETADRG